MFLFAVCAAVLFAAAAVSGAGPKKTVIVIYSAGIESEKSMSEEDSTIDGKTNATPKKAMNAKMAAYHLAKAFGTLGLAVSVKEALDIKDPGEIMNKDCFVIISPTRFNNMSWEIKKLSDQVFHAIYKKKGKLNGKPASIIATSEIVSSAKDCIGRIGNVIGQCDGKVEQTLILLNETAFSEAEKQVSDFAAAFTASLRN